MGRGKFPLGLTYLQGSKLDRTFRRGIKNLRYLFYNKVRLKLHTFSHKYESHFFTSLVRLGIHLHILHANAKDGKDSSVQIFELVGIPVSYTHLTLPTIYSV